MRIFSSRFGNNVVYINFYYDAKLLTVDCHIKVHLDLQAGKFSVVVNGPFFP
jgi:hypothetical protein